LLRSMHCQTNKKGSLNCRWLPAVIDKIWSHLADRGLYAIFLLSMAVLIFAYHAGLPSAAFINVGDSSDQRYVHNFFDREQGVFPFRWTKQSSTIRVPELACVPTTIRLAAAAARPQREPLPTLTILANSKIVAHFVVQNEIGVYELTYSPPVQRCLLPRDLLLHVTSDTFDPPGEDARSLGVLLNTVEVTPTPTLLSLHAMSLPASLILSLTGTLSLCFCYLLLRQIRLSTRFSALCCLVVLAPFAITVARRVSPLGPTFASLALLPVAGVAIVATLRYLGYWSNLAWKARSLDERVFAGGWRGALTYSRAGLPMVLWALTLTGFVALGWAGLARHLDCWKVQAPTKWATTDAWLAHYAGICKASEALVDALERLPSDEPILFVGPSDEPNLMPTYGVISYLAWPRRVSAVTCGQPDDVPSVGSTPPTSVTKGGVVVYLLQPPDWSLPRESVGPAFVVAPCSEMRECTSFCP